MSSWYDFKKAADETVGKAAGPGQYVHVHSDSAFDLIAERDALLAERDAAQKDAERYRVYRRNYKNAEACDAHYDALISAALQGEQP